MNEVEKYLEKVPEKERSELERIRQIVKKELPDAEEVISYGMPGFKYKGRYLLGYAAFKNHLSLFPTNQPIADLGEKLKDFATAKGTMQFSVEKPIPESLIREIIETKVESSSKK